MDKITLNYGRLHTLELKNVIKHALEARICTAISRPRQSDAQKVSSSMTDDMVSRAQEGV